MSSNVSAPEMTASLVPSTQIRFSFNYCWSDPFLWSWARGFHLLWKENLCTTALVLKDDVFLLQLKSNITRLPVGYSLGFRSVAPTACSSLTCFGFTFCGKVHYARCLWQTTLVQHTTAASPTNLIAMYKFLVAGQWNSWLGSQHRYTDAAVDRHVKGRLAYHQLRFSGDGDAWWPSVPRPRRHLRHVRSDLVNGAVWFRTSSLRLPCLMSSSALQVLKETEEDKKKAKLKVWNGLCKSASFFVCFPSL